MSGDAWVIHVALQPREPDSSEMLELVMAGASLDVPLVVLFSGAGRHHLRASQAARWRQLVDFGLARLVYQIDDDAEFSPQVPAEGLDTGQVDALFAHARGVLQL